MDVPAPDDRPVIAVSMGDPLGIGAEIICKALTNQRLRIEAGYRIFGSIRVLEQAARALGIPECWQRKDAVPMRGDVFVIDDETYQPEENAAPGPTAAGGAASFHWVEQAIADAKAGRSDAIVTAPISKTSWTMAGHTQFPGHTELLADRFNAKRSGMLFVSPRLTVMLVTIHVPLMSVASLLTVERVLEAIELANEACRKLFLWAGFMPTYAREKDTIGGSPRIAVCGLNPHAGEGGILGTEDDRIIAPAIAAARAKHINVHGPLPADTIFRAAARLEFGKSQYDCVVAMYHDQGLIPVKLLDGHKAVNVTVGLPAIRTSPAHGTAFDIAGKGIANAESMSGAIALATALSGKRSILD